VPIGGTAVRVQLFVATLGYSRRPFVRAFRHERQSAWFDGIEGAFRHFGGVPQEVVFDNPRALVDHHDAATREVRFNACTPLRLPRSARPSDGRARFRDGEVCG
jgi:transposase